MTEVGSYGDIENLADRLCDEPYEPILRTIGRVAEREGIEAYAVGGMVRDVLLGRSTTDLDFVTVGPGTGIELAEAVAEELGGHTAHVYPKFGTAALRLPASGPDQGPADEALPDEALELEFVAARKESYRSHSRKPEVEAGTLEDDQYRRDFTVNAMAIHLTPDRFGDLVDPFDGRRDLERQTIDTPPRKPSGETFEDDPLRMIRAARFATQLEFRVSDRVFDAMGTQAHRVEILSQERITEEIHKILEADTPSIGFKILEASGVLAHVMPEIQRLKGVDEVNGRDHKDNFYHTLEVLDNVAERTRSRQLSGEETRWLRWAALLHDVAKPQTKRFDPETGWTFHGHEDRGARMIPDLFRKWRLPTDERMTYVQKLVRLHLRPIALADEEVTDSAVRRLLYEAGDAIDDLMILVRSDVTSNNPDRRRRYLEAFDRVEEKMRRVEEKDRLRNFETPVDGYEIMETLDIEEGVAVGIAKTWIREAILDGEIPNEHDAAFEYLLEIKDEALRRGDLFETMQDRLEGPENQALGAIKEVVFEDPDLPDDRAAAIEYLDAVMEEVLSDDANDADGEEM